MKNYYRILAVMISCTLAGAAPISALRSEAALAEDISVEEAAVTDGQQVSDEEEQVEETAAVTEETVEGTSGTENINGGIEDTSDDSVGEEKPADTAAGNESSEPSQPEANGETAVEGTCGEKLTWKYIEGVLLIEGTGEMYDYDADHQPEWLSFAGEIEELRIKKGITLLDGDAFECLEMLKTICFEGSESDWNEIGYAGDKEKEIVFAKVTEYSFDVEAADGPEEVNESGEEQEAPESTETEPPKLRGAVMEEDLVIVAEPQDISAAVGETVNLHVEVNSEDVFFQWQWSKNGTAWYDCTSAGYDTDTFSFKMKETLNGRKYRCIVFNDNDEVATRAATISIAVYEALEITMQPQNVEATAGEQVNVHVESNKTDASYIWQWSKDGNTWRDCTSAGYNTDTFSFTMKEIINGRQYRCIVTCGDEQVISDAATIIFVSEEVLEITEQPQSVEAAAGERVSFHVEANGDNLSYKWQWSSNGTTWKNCSSSGYNTDTFGFVMKATISGRQYRCAVTSGSQTVISDAAVVTIAQDAVQITIQPESVEAAAGEKVTLHVEANGENLTYQWQWSSNGTTWKNCSSAGYNTDTFSFLMKEFISGRQYRCAVTSGSQTVNSDAAVITLAQNVLEIITHPEDVEAAAGEAVMLHVEANGENLTYQWQWSSNGTTWKNCSSGGYNTDTFSFKMKEALDNRMYRCVVTSGSQSVTSEYARITLGNAEIEIDGVVYQLIDNEMTVVRYNGSDAAVAVQETVDGHTVTVIGESAFEGSSIVSIDLPDTIQLIKKRAFADCYNLTNMN